MARIPLGAKTVLNLSTDLDAMFIELYAAAGGDFSTIGNMTVGAGAAVRSYTANGGTGAAEGAAFIGRRAGSNSFILGDAGAILGAGGADTVLYTYGANSQRFYTNGAERGRFTSGSGDAAFVVAGSARFAGANVVTSSLNGVHAGTATGFPQIVWVNAGAGVDGKVWDFYADATGLQLRAVNDANTLAPIALKFFRSGTTVQAAEFGSLVRPGADNAYASGGASFRWSVVYAGSGSINTSDAREKTAVRSLTTAEIAASIALAKEFGAYQFLDAVAAKGEDAREHIGMTVQRAIEIMEEHELDPMRYGFICHDAWPEVQTPARTEERQEETALVDSNGAPIIRTYTVEVEPARTTPAGDRYAFRPDELMMFIARGFHERLAALEASA